MSQNRLIIGSNGLPLQGGPPPVLRHPNEVPISVGVGRTDTSPALMITTPMGQHVVNLSLEMAQGLAMAILREAFHFEAIAQQKQQQKGGDGTDQQLGD